MVYSESAVMLSAIALNVTMLCNGECDYAKCRYGKCRGTDRKYRMITGTICYQSEKNFKLGFGMAFQKSIGI